MTDDRFLEACYRYYFGREPDAEGRRHYLARLAAGWSRRELVRELATSDEHLTRMTSSGALLEAFDSPFVRHWLDPRADAPVPSLIDVRDRYEALARGRITGVALDPDAMLRLLGDLSRHASDLPFEDDVVPGCRFRYANGSFNHFDAIVLACLMRRERPRRVIEVGSGWSSALMLDVRERYLPDLHLTFIDPDPSRLRALLRPGDEARCEVVARPVQEVEAGRFAALGEHDLLFIDSSHVVRFGSDVGYLFLEVLPALGPGVLVHVHDIFWNFEYPREWLLEGRAWTEAYLVHAFLCHNRAWEVVLFHDYLARFHWDALARLLPRCTTPVPGSPFRNAGVSLWLRRRADG